jgi:hypothetical protein
VTKVKRMSAGAAGARSWGRMVAAQPCRASERPTAKSRPARAFAPPKTGTEIEFGPVEYLREGAERTLRAPDIRINCRFISGWEASLEGKVAHGLTAGGARLVGSDVLLKGVLRECSLQRSPIPVSQPNLALSCRGLMTNMGPVQSLMVLSGSAGTGNGSHRRSNCAYPRAACRLLSRHDHRRSAGLAGATGRRNIL